jgi:Na+-translocating ferredoxin:NAD+ oxidoreductase RnfG subunit
MRYLLSAGTFRRWLAIIVWGVLTSSSVDAQFGLVTREEALAAVFPEATVVSERVFLSDTQIKRVAELSRGDVYAKLYARYIATRSGVLIGRAYVDTHEVRTKKQSLLVSLNESGRVRRIDVTVFLEPPEYIATPSWMRQFNNKALDKDLAIQRSIQPIAGATLTAQAVNQAVRRVMAIDQVLTAEAEATP